VELIQLPFLSYKFLDKELMILATFKP